MARAKSKRGLDSRQAEQVLSTAVDAAEALIMGVRDVAQRAIAETARIAEDVRTEVGTALARIKDPARKVATGADGRAAKRNAMARATGSLTAPR